MSNAEAPGRVSPFAELTCGTESASQWTMLRQTSERHMAQQHFRTEIAHHSLPGERVSLNLRAVPACEAEVWETM